MSEEETDTRNWFLRIASGVVFGPVPTKALRLWAEQGRVQPGNEISLDRKNWIPAPSLEELDIVWYLEDNQGNLTGPFNKRAAEKLISDGRVGEGTSIVHKDDADLAHLVRPAIENRRKKAAGGAPELDFGAEDDAASADENALRTECEGLRLRVEVLEKSQKQLLAAAEKECKSHERQLQAERNRVSKLEAELEETRLAAAAARNAETQTSETDAQLAVAEAKRAEAEAALAEQAARHKDELAAAEAKCAEAEAALAEQAARHKDELAAVEAKCAEAEAALSEQAAKGRDELAAAEAKCAEADAALAEQAAKHKDELATVEAKRAEAEAALAEQVARHKDELAAAEAKCAEADAALAEQAAKGKDELAAAEAKCAEAEAALAEQAARYKDELAAVEAKCAEAEAALAEQAARYKDELAAAEAKSKDELAAVRTKCAEGEAELAEQAEKHKDELAVAKAMCAEVTAKLEALQAEYAELLAFSNERDAQAETRIAELSRRPQISISDEADRVFATEIEYLNSLFDEGQKRQKLVRERIDELVALRSGGLVDAAERQARIRAEKAALDRNREEINNLRLENARNAKHAEAREQELQRRIRLLEIELSQTKESAREADDLRQRVQNLTDAVNDRDQILVRERQERAVEHQQLEQAQQALLQRLESLEKAAVEQREAPKQGTAEEAASEAPPPPPPPRPRKPLFHATPWMSFKK